jgi:hypothetical protein
MAGLVPAIHVLVCDAVKTWMPATSAGMTLEIQLLLFRMQPGDQAIDSVGDV